jgi:hypothetical protein
MLADWLISSPSQKAGRLAGLTDDLCESFDSGLALLAADGHGHALQPCYFTPHYRNQCRLRLHFMWGSKYCSLALGNLSLSGYDDMIRDWTEMMVDEKKFPRC